MANPCAPPRPSGKRAPVQNYPQFDADFFTEIYSNGQPKQHLMPIDAERAKNQISLRIWPRRLEWVRAL